MIRFISALAFLAGATAAHSAEIVTIGTPSPVTSLVMEGDRLLVQARGSVYRLVTCQEKTFCLVPVEAPAAAVLPEGALPDGSVVVDASGKGTIRRAWYGRPTDRYPHGALGDDIEGGSLVAETADGKRVDYVLPDTHVFEDLTPRIADLDGDGTSEIVTIRSGLATGGAIAIYGLRDGKLTELAVAAEIGTPNRWMNIAAILPADPDKQGGAQVIYAVRTPHIGGVLFAVRFEGTKASFDDRLATDVTNHVYGSREQGLAYGGMLSGTSHPVLVMPSQDRRSLRFALGSHADIRLPGAVDKALLALDGWLITATENGRLIAIRR